MWWLHLMGEKSLVAVVFSFGDSLTCGVAQRRLLWLAAILGQHITTYRAVGSSRRLGVVFEYSMVETDVDRVFEEMADFGATADMPDVPTMEALKQLHCVDGGFFGWIHPPT